MTPLNLSRHPFRNERVPTTLLSVAVLLLVATTARHGAVAWGLLPGKAGDLETGVLALEAEATRLTAEATELRRVEASPEAVKEWLAVKALVDRRAFSWTGLFSALEEGLPAGVKLVSVTPQAGDAGTDLTLSAVGRDEADALALLESLQARPEFEGAFLNGWNQGRDGVDISCTVRYSPGRARAREERP